MDFWHDFKLQKTSVRIISVRKYNAHTEPIFKELTIIYHITFKHYN